MDASKRCLSENTLSELLTSGPASDAALERSLLHAAECPACRRLLAATARSAASNSGRGAEPDHEAGTPESRALLLRRGATVGRYIVIDLRGSGGMGIVYEAYDPDLDRKVALKLLRPQRAQTAREVGTAALLREAQALARLRHPSVVAVYDVGTCEGQVFIAMELVVGKTAAEWLADSPRTLSEILDLFQRAGQGLWAAHQAGIIHRDFKPTNVLIEKSGDVRVLDFGLAQLAARPGEERTDDEPHVLRGGTPAYMAPEQASGETIDARSDQYSFCVALYQAVYGVRPARSVETEGHGPAPRWLQKLLKRGLSTDPAQRFPDMAALLSEMEQHRQRRWPWVALAALSLLGAVAAGATAQSYRAGTGRPSPCAEAAAQILSLWDDAQRRSVEATFLRSRRPFARASFERVDQGVSAYVRALAVMQQESCEARRLHKQPNETSYRLRRDCLARRRQDLTSLTRLLVEADGKVVEGSVKLVALLPQIETCADAARLELGPPVDERLRERADAVGIELTTAQTLRKAGRYTEGLSVVERAVAAAQQLGVRPLIAEVLEERARLNKQIKNIPAAEAGYRAALIEAEASRHDVAAARLWIELVLMMGYWQNKLAEARSLIPFARAAVERVGQPTDLAGALYGAIGMIELSAGDSTAALANQQQALVLYERAFGASHLKLIEPLTALGEIHRMRDEPQQMLKVMQRAHDVTLAELGPEHPVFAGALGNVGTANFQLDHLKEAYTQMRRALEVLERNSPGAKYLHATLNQNLAAVCGTELRYDEALLYSRRAVQLGEEVFGKDSPKLCSPLMNRAVHLANLGHPEEARRDAQRAYELARKAHGENHPQTQVMRTELASVLRITGDPRAALALWQSAPAGAPKTPEQEIEEQRRLLERGLCLLALGQAEAARRALEEALRRYGPLYDKPQRSELLFGLAQALRGSEEERARSLATEAHELLRELQGQVADKRRAAIAAWRLKLEGAAVGPAR